MELITNSVLASRWENTRVPPNAAEMSSTCILRVKIHSGSAKVREGGPLDEKGDVGDEGTVGRVWTGTLPMWEHLGEVSWCFSLSRFFVSFFSVSFSSGV